MPDNLVTAARAFIGLAKGLQIPNGPTKDTMPDKLQKSKGGLSDCLRGLAEFIDQHQDMVAVAANNDLLARLRGEDAKDLAGLVINIAIGDADMSAIKLREALKVKGTNVFEAMALALKNIARDQKVKLQDNNRQFGGDDEPRRPDKWQEQREKENNTGTWAESLNTPPPGVPDVSNEDIRKSAKEFDKTGQPINDKDIKKSAQDGPGEFIPSRQEKSAYERSEDDDRAGSEYLRQQANQNAEIQKYYNLISDLSGMFNATLGKILGEKASIAAAVR